ncbi:hypothetical protein [Microbacterium sp. Root61]|uniref:hypothetical protein n=1 Tax=Microbacterium sp. Root61 TaxID=1736570 RepID=UPI000AD18AAC|nr:hypothetical protein [Microbacterium sp. Root61]
MFIVAMVLFLGGMYLFGLAFTITEWQGLVFVLGILAISAALAIPTHLLNRR